MLPNSASAFGAAPEAPSVSVRLEDARRTFRNSGDATHRAGPYSLCEDVGSGGGSASRAERAFRFATAIADRRLAGRSFGGYRLDRVLGQGRFGTGFLAVRSGGRDVGAHGDEGHFEGVRESGERGDGAPRGDAPVFMKLVKPRGGAIDRTAVWAECAALSLCDHPGIPRWMGIVNEGGRYFIVESLIAGAPLASLLSSGRVFGQEEMASIGRSLIEIAAHMAERGVVHNDIRPANVLVAPDRIACLAGLPHSAPVLGALRRKRLARIGPSCRACRPRGAGAASLRVGLVDFGLAEFFDRGIVENRAIRVAGADVAGIAETVIHMLYSDRMRVRSRLSRTAPWYDALLISPGQRRLLLDMFEGRIESHGILLERFEGAFGSLAPRLPFFDGAD